MVENLRLKQEVLFTSSCSIYLVAGPNPGLQLHLYPPGSFKQLVVSKSQLCESFMHSSTSEMMVLSASFNLGRFLLVWSDRSKQSVLKRNDRVLKTGCGQHAPARGSEPTQFSRFDPPKRANFESCGRKNARAHLGPFHLNWLRTSSFWSDRADKWQATLGITFRSAE